jgi:hypothetical protein
MANDTITFFCPACSIKLTVPAKLAGVEGPCPSCGKQIQAPEPVVPEPVVQEVAKEPVLLKPEPRQLPSRPAGSEMPVRHMPETASVGEARHRMDRGSFTQDPYFRNLIRLLIFGVFLLASGAFVYGVLTFLKRQPPVDPAHAVTEPFSFDKQIEERNPTDHGEEVTELPQVSAEDSAGDVFETVDSNSPWRDAEAVLEKFLSATTLAERLPLIETRTPEDELEAGCLAGPLPAATLIVPESRETTAAENIVDFYYTVEFQSKGAAGQAQTILVRSRGDGPPRIVADPFLDTFGGRLAAYTAAPAEKGGVFQVVVYAVASCTDPNIPNREKKLTLKLLASDNHKEIARAYFGRQSKIAEMLEDGTYGLNYGSAKACTVLVRWNTEDNPDYPYLEALAIKDLGWNP